MRRAGFRIGCVDAGSGAKSADKAAVIIAEIIRSDNNRWEVVGGGPGFNDFASLLTSYGAII